MAKKEYLMSVKVELDIVDNKFLIIVQFNHPHYPHHFIIKHLGNPLDILGNNLVDNVMAQAVIKVFPQIEYSILSEMMFFIGDKLFELLDEFGEENSLQQKNNKRF